MKERSLEVRPVQRELGYRPALDGLRGVAVLLVVLFHSSWLRGGFLGVDLFFVLSGFLITTLLLEEWEAIGRISLSSFYVRRFLRLFPALMALLLAYLIVVLVLHRGDVALSLRSALESGLYVSNLVLAGGRAFASELTHLWSLATEEQFYLLWPPVLVLALKSRFSHRALVALLLALAAASVGLQAFFSLRGAAWARLTYGPDVRMATILIGCALGVAFVAGWLPSGQPSRRVFRGAAGMSILGLGLLAVLITPYTRALFFGGYAFVAVSAALVIGCIVSSSWPGLDRALSVRPLVYVGRISYSLYLWHVLLISLVNFTVRPRLGAVSVIAAIGLSFVAAALSHRYVEQPFLRLKKRFARVDHPELRP